MKCMPRSAEEAVQPDGTGKSPLITGEATESLASTQCGYHRLTGTGSNSDSVAICVNLKAEWCVYVS